MKRFLKWINCIMIILLLPIATTAQDEFDVIRKNIVNGLLHQAKQVENNIGVIQKQQQANGSWSDIRYTDSAITAWEPIRHLQRIKNYCLHLNLVQDCCLKENILSGLRFWLSVSPKSKNWWHNEIATPQTMGEILLLLEETKTVYPVSLKDSLIASMKKGNPYVQTGANKLDIAIHYLYRACATKNSALMDSAVQQAFEPISFTTKEGLQYDYSYLQHGRQLQLSSYGAVFLMGEYKVASWLLNTGFALQAEKINILQTYLTKTYLKTIRGHYIDFNVEGRGISRPNVLDKRTNIQAGYSDNANTPLVLAKKVNPADTLEISEAIARIQGIQTPDYAIKPYHKYFYKADYTLHLRKEYTFNVRTVSVRTKRTETGNKENLYGKFLPDGSTNIQRAGDEYYNIMPVWEWNKIPGITCRNFKNDQPATEQWGEPGSTEFVGGVSDGVYGCSVYDMQYDHVFAKKAWFFFDKEIVCLGAGIACTENENVLTTLNQCWLRGDVSVKVGGKERKANETEALTAPSWVWHDSIGYCFLQAGTAFVSTAVQKGSWKKINDTYSAKELQGNVFKLFIDHGAKPVSTSYAYCVLPGISLNEMRSYPANDIKVIDNNNAVQAVAHQSLNILQACFYEQGMLGYGQIKITVDKPCVLMMKNIHSRNPEIWVADPSQKQTEVQITIHNGSEQTINRITLPDGENKGQSVLMQNAH